MSQVSPDILEELLEQLKAEFGTITPLLTNRGPVHDYLGMTLDLSVKGKVQVTMKSYIHNMLTKLPADMDGVASTPAADHLFQVNPKLVLLDKEATELFHHHITKLLFLCKHAWRDIQTAVAFLSQ